MRDKTPPNMCCGASPPEEGTNPRGRPLRIAEAERRDRLIEAAEKVFVETGYSTSSVDDIARAAGMSKKTIYRLYETKEQLFTAVIAQRRALLKAMLEAHGCSGAAAPADVLKRFLGQVARFVLAPRQVALYRLVIAESHRTPELACAFYREGPIKARTALTRWLALQHERKVLHVPDPALSACMLFSMVISEPQMRVLIGEAHDPEELPLDERVAYAVELFLQGAQRRPAIPASLSTKRIPPKKDRTRELVVPAPVK